MIIWKLASSNIEYRTLAGIFGIGRSTACQIVNDTAKQIVTHLLPKYVKLPSGDWVKETVEDFHWNFHKLQVLSMVPRFQSFVHSTANLIITTKRLLLNYYAKPCGLSWHFMDSYIGWPGKVHNGQVFANSAVL